VPYLSASELMIHYEELLYQLYVSLPLPLQTNRVSQADRQTDAFFYLLVI